MRTTDGLSKRLVTVVIGIIFSTSPPFYNSINYRSQL